jgi:DUF971 family protein
MSLTDSLQTMPQPSEIRLDRTKRLLKVTFDDGSLFELPSEYLRVYSRSAEVRGHGSGEGVLQTDKENVKITDVQSVGNYAVRLIFDDGHNTGLYTWDFLYELGSEKETKWQAYLARLRAAGYSHPSQGE